MRDVEIIFQPRLPLAVFSIRPLYMLPPKRQGLESWEVGGQHPSKGVLLSETEAGFEHVVYASRTASLLQD